jgi:hypothetical protein
LKPILLHVFFVPFDARTYTNRLRIGFKIFINIDPKDNGTFFTISKA